MWDAKIRANNPIKATPLHSEVSTFNTWFKTTTKTYFWAKADQSWKLWQFHRTLDSVPGHRRRSEAPDESTASRGGRVRFPVDRQIRSCWVTLRTHYGGLCKPSGSHARAASDGNGKTLLKSSSRKSLREKIPRMFVQSFEFRKIFLREIAAFGFLLREECFGVVRGKHVWMNLNPPHIRSVLIRLWNFD